MHKPISLLLLGGFLGSGKTTALIRLARHFTSRGQRVGIIANDQGAELVDTALFRSAGFTTGEVTGGCFCCRFEDFVQTAQQIIEKQNPDVLLAEPVGSCTDLVATVVKPISRLYPDRFHFAPFVSLMDPSRVLGLEGQPEPERLSEAVAYIFRMQQQEANAIAINKADLLPSKRREEILQWACLNFPNSRVFLVSAKTGEGFPELISYIEAGDVPPTPLPGLDYDLYAQGEAELGWLNSTTQVQASKPALMDALAWDLATRVETIFTRYKLPIMHGKFALQSGNNAAVVNLVHSNSRPEVSQSSKDEASAFVLIVNLRAHGDPAQLAEAAQTGMKSWLKDNALSATKSTLQWLSPSRPTPVHRIVE